MAIDVSLTNAYIDEDYYGNVGKGGNIFTYNKGSANTPSVNYITNTGGISPWTNRSYPKYGTTEEVSTYYAIMQGYDDTSLYDGRFYYRSDLYNYGSAVIEYLADGSIYEEIDPYNGMVEIIKRINPSDNYAGVYLGAASYRDPVSPRGTTSWAELTLAARDSSVVTQYSSITLSVTKTIDTNHIIVENDAITIGDVTRYTDISTYLWGNILTDGNPGFSGTFSTGIVTMTFVNGLLVSVYPAP